MPIFTANADLCRKDGICASVCVAHAIKGPKGELPRMRPGAEASCIACGHCMAFCPHGAAKVDVLEGRAVPIERSLLPSAEAADLLLISRRSARRFKKTPVDQERIGQLLETARYAPTAKNRRPVRWVAVHAAKSMAELGDCIAQYLEGPGGEHMVEARRLARAWRSGLDPLFRGAPHLILAVTPKEWKWGAVDAAIALTYLELAAHAHGLGACWAGYVTWAAQNHAPVRRLLGVEENEQVSGGQVLGVPSLRPRAVPPRLRAPVSWL